MPQRPNDDPPRRLGVQLHAEPELHPVEAQSAEGQRLDDARAEFRAEWQAKLQAKREGAEHARRAEDLGIAAQWKLLAGGAGVGAALGLLIAVCSGSLANVPFGLVTGILAGVIMILPLEVVVLAATAGACMRAERLEREVREMERS